MAEYTDIALGTSNPIDICQGLELLSKNAPGRVGIVATNNSHQFFDLSVTAVFSRLKLSAYYDYNMGICGPSVAFLFDAPEGANLETKNLDADTGQVSVSLPNQDMLAGLFMGFGFGGGVHVVEQNYLPKKWTSPWKLSWQTAFDKKVGFEIDLLEILFILINYLADSDSNTNALKQDLSGTLKNTSSSWQLLGDGNGLNSDFEIEATPSYPIPIDLVDFCPELQEFNKILHKVKGKLQFGPQFTVAIPVKMTLDKLTLDGAGDFIPATIDTSSGDLTATGPAFGATAPTQITTHVSYEAGFTLELNVFFKLSACKLFSFNYTSPSLDLLDLMGLPEPKTDAVDNQVQTNLSDGCVLAPAMIFHPADLGTVAAGVGLFLSLDFDFPGGGGFPGSDPCCTEIEVTTDTPIPGFPTYIPVENGAGGSGGITVFFPKALVPDGQGGSVSASPTTPGYTVNLTATAPPNIDPGCAAPIVATKPVIVTMPVISADLSPTDLGPPGDGPVWNPVTGGVILKAQTGLPPTVPGPPSNSAHLAHIQVSYSGTVTTDPVDFTFTLLDALRNPYQGLRVGIIGTTQAPTLSPSGVVTESFSSGGIVDFEIQWNDMGPMLTYSERYILVIDAGVEYGQTEFWLDVWYGNPTA